MRHFRSIASIKLIEVLHEHQIGVSGEAKVAKVGRDLVFVVEVEVVEYTLEHGHVLLHEGITLI